jgi:cytochrome b561
VNSAAEAASGDLDRYDPVAQWAHWSVAVLATIVVALGLVIPLAARGSAARAAVLLLHRSLGLTILAVMMARVMWRLYRRPPPFPAGFPRVEAAAAYADHLLLYLIFLVMPISGYINAAAAGHPVSLFRIATIPPLLPPDYRLAQIADAVHMAGQFGIYTLVGLHVAGALHHTRRGRYRILARMLPPRASSG